MLYVAIASILLRQYLKGVNPRRLPIATLRKVLFFYVQLPRLRLSNFFFDVKFRDLYESLHRLYYKGTCRTLVMGLVAPITLYTLLRSTRTSICDGLDGVNNEKRAHAM